MTNIIGHVSDHVTDEVQLRVIAYWTAVDTVLGGRIADGLGRDTDAGIFKDATRVLESRANRA